MLLFGEEQMIKFYMYLQMKQLEEEEVSLKKTSQELKQTLISVATPPGFTYILFVPSYFFSSI